MPSVRSGYITWKLDDVGEFSVIVPQSEGTGIKPGSVITLTRGGQDVARVYVTDVKQRADGDYHVKGHTLIAELNLMTTGQGRSYENQSVNSVVDDLIAPAGWSRSGSVTQVVSVRFDGRSLLEALSQVVVGQAGGHFRDESTTTARVVGIGLGSDSGVTIDSTKTREVWLVEDDADITNAIIPLGSGTGDSQITVEYQTRLPNLLTNPSFEQGTTGWTADTEATLAVGTTRAVHGKQSLTVSAASALSTRGAYQTVSVTAGKRYRVEAWGWLVSGSHIGLQLEWWDSAGQLVGIVSDTKTGTGLWQRLSVTATAPSSAAQVQIKVGVVGSNASASFDLVRFWETASSAGRPLELETTIPLATAPFPNLNWVLVDESSIVQYGRRERAVTFKEIAPTATTVEALQNAANALYDAAAAFVAVRKDPRRSYRMSLAQDPGVRPGDRVRLVWSGEVRVPRGSQLVNINELYWVITKTRRFLPDGSDIYGLNIASQPVSSPTTVESVIGQIQVLIRTVSTVPQTSVSNWTETHALQQALDSTGPLSFDLTVPDNCVSLLLCKLRLTPRPIRSNARGALSNTSYTSSAGASHSHGLSGVTTDGANATSPHSHGFTGGQTTNSEATHTHTIGGHTHDLQYGIYEGTTPLDLRLLIDGVDRTSELGGPWNAKAVLDITRYLKDSSGLPVKGDHTITIQTSRLGAVDVKSEWVAVVAAVTPS